MCGEKEEFTEHVLYLSYLVEGQCGHALSMEGIASHH